MSFFVLISAHNQGILTIMADLYIGLLSRDGLKFASLVVGPI